MNVDLELSWGISAIVIVLLIFDHSSSMDSNEITESLDDWEVLEFVCFQNDLSEFTFFAVFWINDLNDALEFLLVSYLLDILIWESGINDDTVEVDFLTSITERDFADFLVIVLR